MLRPLPARQRGITLIESLAAIVVLALGVLGILGVQMRTLADTQTGMRRAQAIRLTEDLSERIRANPRGLSLLASYATDGWDANLDTAVDCEAQACDSDALARHDSKLWLQTVRETLPLGDAAVFLVADETNASNRRQLGVMIRWRENERADAGDAKYRAIFEPADTGTAGISCPNQHSCHLQYIQPSARCLPYAAGNRDVPLAICPG